MKKLYLVFLMTMFSALQAQIVNIPDANFKSILLSNVPNAVMAFDLMNNLTIIDKNHDGEIQLSEAANISKLNIRVTYFPANYSQLFSNLVSMEGIQSFTNLTSLDIDGLPLLQTLDLSNNTLLYNLEVSRCYVLSSLNLQGCSQLHDMEIFASKIASINLSGLTNLYDVSILQCQLENIYLNNNTNLNSLNLALNKLQTIPINQTPNLKFLTLTQNQISTLDFSGFPKLEALGVSLNKFITIDLSQNKNLTSFYCDKNPFLQSLFIKNGIHNLGSTPTNTSSFTDTPSLVYICADDFEIPNIISLLPSVNTCVVNSYCSFTPGGTFYNIQGNTKVDGNNNGCDANDANKAFQKFSITGGGVTGTMIANTSGDFSLSVQPGSHTVTPVLENPAYFNISPTSFTANFPQQTSPFIQNFCITPNGVHNDLETVIVPVTAASPGFESKYKIVYKNKGNTTQSGTLVFNYNENITDYMNATLSPSSQSSGTLNWNFTNLLPFETREITVTLKLNTPTQTPAVNGGDILHYTAQINGATDENPADNNFTLNQTVVNSFDPNDKTCIEGTSIAKTQVGDYVHYLIRFENTGTANARNIVVKDEIDTSKFDISSLVALNGSHSYVTRVTNPNIVEFIFENIQLPFDDANNDGYVAFKIKTKSTLNAGDSFSNTANIYFDYNAPIVTNTYTTSIQGTLSTSEVKNDKNTISIYPNPVKDILYITSINKVAKVEIYDTAGRIITSMGVKEDSINVSDLPKGNYMIKLFLKDKVSVQKFIKE
ncbi:T9SS type A sorting domain-containing protein [Chryseobacterium indologenes]|uniref:T9SS type A sorting domain-containing protein n=1 Tax=Chryseobacterium indologenes TaxID=253 RepID=UPI0023E80E02|nr:T9SS type A sorting domain-containing protein [Chryseobacterium indologenes]WET49073.1 T9SS type A sorting domain-containing protein [Chryseobacterium indologenes]